MPTNISTNYLSFNSLVSRAGEDARVLATGGIDFTVDSSYNIDLTATVQSAGLRHPIQAVYMDCSQVSFGPTTLTVNGTGQRIVVPPGVQGYYPLLIASRNFVFTLQNNSSLRQSPGSGTALLYFLNVPMVAAEWQTQPAAAGGGGSMTGPVRTVSGVAIDNAAVTDGTLLVDCTLGDVVEYLPPNLSGFQTMVLTIVKKDTSAHQVLITGGTIAGNPNGIILGMPYEAITLQWTGGVWEPLHAYNGAMQSANGQAMFDMRNGSQSGGTWWRYFVDNGANNGGIACGWYDVNNNRVAGGFDTSGNLTANYGLTLKNPQSATLGGGWLNFFPGITGWNGMTVSGISFTDNQYLIFGPFCFFKLYVNCTLGGTASNQIFITTPTQVQGPSMLVPAIAKTAGASGLSPAWAYCDPLGSLCKLLLPGEVNFPLGPIGFLISGYFRAI